MLVGRGGELARQAGTRADQVGKARGSGQQAAFSRRPAAYPADRAAMSGLAKELTDDHLDRGDLVADAIGAGLAACFVAALTR